MMQLNTATGTGNMSNELRSGKWLRGARLERQKGIDRLNREQLSVLIVAAKWWPLSARLALAFLGQGCRVSALCPPAHPLTKVSGVDRVDVYEAHESLESLRRTLTRCAPDYLVPCDDGVVAQLHALHALDPQLRPVIERSIGLAAGYRFVASRLGLLTLAGELGIAVPRTRAIADAPDLARWRDEVAAEGVLKADGETAGNGVRIARSFDAAMLAWRELHAPMSRLTAWKRRFIDRDPLALWSQAERPSRTVIIQELIDGRPANSMIACHDGVVLSIVSVAVVASEGPTGASTVVRRIQNERMALAAELIAERLQLTGFFGLDYVIDTQTGVPYLIELNPRSTQLGHFEFANQPSLVAALVASWRGVPGPVCADPVQNDLLAFYPQALAAGPSLTALVAASHLDIPAEAPELAAELQLPSWPQRRPIARLYHALRPPVRSAPVVFEAESDFLPGDQRARAAVTASALAVP
jgi:hypothetical protein